MSKIKTKMVNIKTICIIKCYLNNEFYGVQINEKVIVFRHKCKN